MKAIEFKKSKVKFIKIPQGNYIKTLAPYYYHICKLSDHWNYTDSEDCITVWLTESEYYGSCLQRLHKIFLKDIDEVTKHK